LINISSERTEMVHSGGRTEIDRHGDANSRFFEILQTRLTTESYGSADVHKHIRQPHSKTTQYSVMHVYQKVQNLQILRFEPHRGCPCAARGPAAARMTNASPSLIDLHSNVN